MDGVIVSQKQSQFLAGKKCRDPALEFLLNAPGIRVPQGDKA
jgi:hypothetical protein